MLLRFTLFLTLLLSAAPGWAATCPYESAHYVLQGYPDVTAQFFRRQPARAGHLPDDLFFEITIQSRNWSFWYAPDTGNGYSTISLISTDDPTKAGWQPPNPDTRQGRPNQDELYYGFAADMAPRDDIPRSGVAADDLIFIPDLGMHIWYSPVTVVHGDRYTIPRAMFRLDHCGPPQTLILK